MNNSYPTSSHARSRHRSRRHSRRTVHIKCLAALVGSFLCLSILAWLWFQQSFSWNRGDTNTVSAAVESSGVSSYSSQTSPQRQADTDPVAALRDSGEYYPEELLELAEKNPETLEFVRSYPQLHDQHPEIDLSAEAKADSVPLLLQWDTRWGYESYGSGMIAYTACGPTCLSMVALYLTGDASATPLAVANYAESAGYYVQGSGTAWTLMSEGCEHYGLTSRELGLDESAMKQALDNGEPIILSMGPGDFTDNGHYIVVTGYTDQGFTVNDPNSPQRSSQAWTFDAISGQIRNLWAFSANN